MQVAVCDKYLSLLRRHVAGNLDHSDFERDFLRMMKEEKDHLPLEVYFVLEELFGVVESYCPDAAIRDTGDADEEALIQASRDALAKLDHLLRVS